MIVRGSPELDRWKDNDGSERITKRIVANDVGADLRWATAEVTNTARRKRSSDELTFADESEEF